MSQYLLCKGKGIKYRKYAESYKAGFIKTLFVWRLGVFHKGEEGAFQLNV